MGRRIGRIAILGATALVLGLVAAPGANAQAAVSCLDLVSFTEVPATVVGTNRSEILRGTPGRDVIAGLDGNDIILGLGGDDAICGGRGNDKVDGGTGGDSIVGDTGESFLLGNPAGMNVPGGNDLLSGAGATTSLAARVAAT
jgi:Ca2+-binding RTX toxin-like protein